MPNQPEQPKSDWLLEILLSTMFNASDIQERYYKRQIESIQTVADMRKNVVEQAAQAIRSQLKERLVAAMPNERERYGPMNENGDYCLDEYINGGFNEARTQAIKAIEKELGGEALNKGNEE